MNNEENVNQNDARAILDGSNGKHKICLLSIIGEVEGHENLSGNTKTTKYDQILPKLAQLEELGDGKQYLVDLTLKRENPSEAENFGNSNPVQLRS
mgnify:CR=1 FL=1